MKLEGLYKGPYNPYENLTPEDQAIQEFFPAERVERALILLGRYKPLVPYTMSEQRLHARFVKPAADLLEGLGLPGIDDTHPLTFVYDLKEAERILIAATEDPRSQWKMRFHRVRSRAEGPLENNEALQALFHKARKDASALPSMRRLSLQGTLGERLAKRCLGFPQLEVTRRKVDDNLFRPLIEAGVMGGHILGFHENSLHILTPRPAQQLAA